MPTVASSTSLPAELWPRRSRAPVSSSKGTTPTPPTIAVAERAADSIRHGAARSAGRDRRGFVITERARGCSVSVEAGVVGFSAVEFSVTTRARGCCAESFRRASLAVPLGRRR